MLSIKETVDKTTEQRKQIGYMLDKGYYDFDEANLLLGLGQEDRHEVMETLRSIQLTDIIRRSGDDLPWIKPKIKEFLAKSSTDGIAGAAYLIPDKIYQVMFDSSVEADICADISITMIPPEQIPGTTLRVDIAKDDSYKPKKYSSGGSMPTETIETVRATLDFSTPWGINFQIANDLIEDAQFDVIEMHLRNAGREMGEYASNEALGVLKTATDGDGTLNGGASGNANETKFTGATTTDIVDCYEQNCVDGYVSDTIVMMHHAFFHSVVTTTFISGGTYSEPWAYERTTGTLPTKMLGCNIIWSNADTLFTLESDGTQDDCVTLVFDKDYALLTGRKRWLRIEKYSDPIRDLVGATVTARQDSVTVYDDAIAKITETAD